MAVKSRVLLSFFTFILSTKGFVWLCFLFLVLLLFSWGFDNEIPAKVTGKITYTGIAKPGGDIVVKVPIKGDLSRNCHLIYSRNLMDSEGVKFDLIGNTYVSHAMLVQMKKAHPGELLINIKIPDSVDKGPAVINFVNSWMCNPWQWLWPIDSIITFPILVEK